MKKEVKEWQIYRTRFLIRARQLTEPVAFTDALGREHNGGIGDYLVESSEGALRIAPRAIFEDIYVLMEGMGAVPRARQTSSSIPDRRTAVRHGASA